MAILPPNYRIDPVGRIEGHLGIDFESTDVMPGATGDLWLHDGHIMDAKLSGTMYRGFENIMLDRQPQEGIQITQRI